MRSTFKSYVLKVVKIAQFLSKHFWIVLDFMNSEKEWKSIPKVEQNNIIKEYQKYILQYIILYKPHETIT